MSLSMSRISLLLAVLLASCTFADDTAKIASPKVDLDAVVAEGVVAPVDGISTAGQPDAAAFKVFAESGYAAVIDLRTAGENRGLEDEPGLVAGLGMEYVPLPIGKGDITVAKARELAELIDSYDAPVLVHCGSANRVGALLALEAYDETGDAALALEVGRAGGMTGLESTVKEVIEAGE